MKTKFRLQLNRVIIMLMLPLGVACSQDSAYVGQSTQTYVPKLLLRYPFTPSSASYTLDLQIEKDSNGEFYIVSTIDFLNGTYLASPFSKPDFIGKFLVHLDPEAAATLTDEITETPNSVETMHENGVGSVNWVKEKTTYRQKINYPTDYNYSCSGKITFTIEPACTFEQIPFILKYLDGQLTIEPDGC